TNVMVDGILSPPVVVMLDPDGHVVWYHQAGEVPTFADVDATLLDDGTVLIGGGLGPGQSAMRVDMAGNRVWLGPTQPENYLAPGSLHHVFRQLPDGHYLTLEFEAQNTVLEDVILELDGDGEVVWEWHAADHIPNATIEHVHGNMALLGRDETAIFFNALLTRSFYKIDRESGEILWTFGEGGDFTIGTPHDWPWVSFAHAPQLLPDGHVLMYDNGGVENHDFSRIVEYALDEESMTAELVWEYPGELADDHWYTQFWGDADRLANGNTLVTAGSVIPMDTPSRLFEVTADGAVVWQLEMASPSEGGLAGSYSSERIRPLVEEL
ncbi:MAG: aryl-sulfate sulfotransferase, partial [Myxococcota bacterium]|nr:aryl-sulfate sulfotransferase [Myxococcota bacterium]